MQRHKGAVIGNFVRGWGGLTGLRVPQLRRLAGYAETGFDGRIMIASVIEEKDIRVRGLSIASSRPS
jgi:hypothetical protein